MNDTPVKKKSGCMKAAGIGCAVVIVLATVVGIVGYYTTKNVIANFVKEYTDEQPKALPALTVSETDANAVFAMVEEFKTTIKSGTKTKPLFLTANDINILIQKHPDWKPLSGNAYVSIDGNTIRAEVSIPLDEIGGIAKGRYLNGAASFNAAMVGDQLALHVAAIEVKSKPLPENFMKGMRAENLAKDVNTNPNLAPVIQRIQSISVEKGQLVIMPKDQ